jgi:hypothetical protein
VVLAGLLVDDDDLPRPPAKGFKGWLKRLF